MALLIIVFGIFSFIGQLRCDTNQYENHTLIRLHPKHENGFRAVQTFQDPEGLVEVLKTSRGVDDTLDILVPPPSLDFVQFFARKHDLLLEEKKHNYGRILKTTDRTAKRRFNRNFDIYSYNSYQQIQEYIDEVAQRNPELVTLQELGKSYNKRSMKLVKISANPNARNPVIFIDAGIHSREWVAPAMALYLIHRLTSDVTARQKGGMLDGVDWYILPVVNPDGYEYSRTGHRMWRKTRSKYSKSDCYGVDGNRNYGFKWAVSGVSSDPCNKETYAGPKPFSEVETRMVRNIMMENKDRIKLYVSLHSYGQYLVYPWGYTGDYLPKTWKKLDSLAKSVSNSVQRAGGKPFKVMSAGKWYPAAGGSDDFAFSLGVPYSYTMELTDGYEFLFPEEMLRLILPQFYEGFVTFGQHIRREFFRQRY